MRHIREFIYDKSDILVALVIIAIASGLIFWRLEAIAAYPKTLVNTKEVQVAHEKAKEKAKEKEKKSEEKAKADKESKASDKDAKENNSEKSSEKDSSSGIYDGGVTGKESTVTVASGSLTDAVQSLVSAGYFSSYDEYVSTCQGAGIDPSTIKTGTFTIPAGSSKNDVVAIVCK